MNLFKNEKFLILFLALSVSVLILIKVFIYDGCFAFDSNDDANHTFVNLKAAQDIMRQGVVPEINLYNNFGTPILGDALTFPFSIQSITYWFLPNYLAMTVNRAIIAFLTVIFLFLFLRTFLSPIASFVSTILVFFAPGALWNFAHHHYQMTLLFFSLILFIQVKVSKKGDSPLFLIQWLCYVLFILSVSIQLVVFSIPFLILFPLIKFGFKKNSAFKANIIAMFLAFIATFPHTYLFLKNIALSTRANWTPYSSIFTTESEQILSLLFPPTEWMYYGINGHFTTATYFSIAFIIFSIIGALTLLSRHSTRSWESNRILYIILILGFLPAVLGIVLQFYLGKHLPLFRSVDSTRVWWFSNLFLALSVGKLIDSNWKKDFSQFIKIIAGIMAASLAVFYISIPYQFPEITELPFIHRFIILLTFSSLILILINKSKTEFGKILIIIALLLTQIPTIVHVMELNMRSCNKWNHYFSYKEAATFQPESILKTMEPYYRLASEEYTVDGHDLKAIFGNVLGSDARAIISSQKLQDILLENKLIKIDANYFFTHPWQETKLSELGIRYLLLKEKNKELESMGWNLISEDKNDESLFLLYENPKRPTLAYINLNGKPYFLENFRLVPNGIEMELPEIKSNDILSVSFSHNKSWSAYVDNIERPVQMSNLGIIVIPLQPGDSNVRLIFKRTSWIELSLYILASFALLIVISRIKWLGFN